MPEELGFILKNLEKIKSQKYGDLEIFSGEWVNSKNNRLLISVAWSGWGKVSAARATSRLISTIFQNKKIDLVIFTGVAGAVDKKLNQWDVVISEAVIQHDMDARPLFDKFVIPCIKNSKIFSKPYLLENFYNIFNETIKFQKGSSFKNIYKGLIGTGDMFISDKEKLNQLNKEIPNLLAVEMEGAAFAQVAHQENVDWIIIRTISDGADDNASEDFNSFLTQYQLKSWELIKIFLNNF